MARTNRTGREPNGTNRRRFLSASAGAAATGLLAGCIGSFRGSDDSGPINIGALLPLSGTFGAWGMDHQTGLEFAVEEVNADGGVLGRELQLVTGNSEGDSTKADSLFRRFVEQDDAVATTGPVSSDVGIRTGQTAEELEVPIYLHMAGSDSILTPDSRFTFRMSDPPPQMQMIGITEMIEQRGFTSVGAMIADYAWGRAVQQTLEDNPPSGVDLQMEVAPLQTSDFKPSLRRFPDDLEAMITVGFPSGATSIVQQEFQIGMELEIYALGGGWAPPRLWWEGMGETALGNVVEIATVSPERQPYVEVAERFHEATGERFEPNMAYGYATIKLIKKAIEEFESTDPGDIAEATRQVSLEEIYPQPLEHTEWGELKNQSIVMLGFAEGAPSYFPDSEWKVTEEFVSDPLEPYKPPG